MSLMDASLLKKRLLVLPPMAVVTGYHKLGGERKQKSPCRGSGGQRPEVKVLEVHVLSEALGRMASRPLSHCWCLLGLCSENSTLHVLVSPWMCSCPNFPFYKDTSHSAAGAHLTPRGPHLR